MIYNKETAIEKARSAWRAGNTGAMRILEEHAAALLEAQAEALTARITAHELLEEVARLRKEAAELREG